MELGYIHSPETRKKISDGNKGRIVSGATRKKISDGNKGRIISEDQKRKISIANTGIVRSAEFRKKVSDFMKGRIVSAETGKKISIAKTGKKRAPFSLETRRKMGLAHQGEKSYLWKGGISKINRLCRGMGEYYQWRSDVFQRDNWTCKTCGINGVYVTAHHIKGFSKIIKENNVKSREHARKLPELWDVNNGITLCEDCHKLTDNYKGRGKKKNI